MSAHESQRAFYREQVPAQFNATLAEQEQLAANDPDAERLYDEMRAVRALIRVEVESDAATAVHLLEIERGEMRPVEASPRAPFFVLRHRLDQFEPLRLRCGASVLGFLGALAGLGDDMRLTSQRVRSLKSLDGTLAFEVTGDKGFSLRAEFGEAAGARASIRLSPEVFEALEAGDLEAQEAFFDEKIEVEGDMEIAVGAALAALSAD